MAWPLALLLLLALAPPILAAPGIDLSANHSCPGVAGASGNPAGIDCVALAEAGKSVSFYGTFVPAEDIPDLVAIDGWVFLQLLDDLDGAGSFWNGSPGSCLDQNGGSVKFIGSKPTNGDPCGSPLQIAEVFTDGSTYTTTQPAGYSYMDYFFTVYKNTGVSVTNSTRIFGFEMRFDPLYAVETGGPCGTCCVGSLLIQWQTCTPKSLAGTPRTVLAGSTGLAGVSNRVYGSPCSPVANRAKTWGQLKTLYR